MGLEETLKDRDRRYGTFMNQAIISNAFHNVLKDGCRINDKTLSDFSSDELEALRMIFNKLARIINGDNHYRDSWEDISGYAMLVANRIGENKHGGKPTWEESLEQELQVQDGHHNNKS